jgi:predicted nucleic acid-binding protein
VILVDTSVWVDHLNDTATTEVDVLRQLIGREYLPVGDLILCEVLQGLRSEAEAETVEEALRRFDIVPIASADVAVLAAAHSRFLREKGIAVRRANTLLIGAFCIGRHISLLHSDPDFMPMQAHFNLQTV